MFHDLLVVELASVLAGPSVGMFFAELGATVLKVEHSEAGGDVTRSWKLPSEDPASDISAYFSSVNWGKSSVAANLATDEGRNIVQTLLGQADIAIVSFKPGDEKRFGMDYEALRHTCPRLIYAHITGYGPDSSRTGYDAVIQAESGFMAMNGTPESGPLKMPVALVDVLAAHQLKEAVLLALIHRMKTGEGSYVTVSLLQTGVASLVNQAAGKLIAGVEPQPMGSDHPTIVPYGSVFCTRDGRQVLFAVGNDRQFGHLCAVLGIPDIAADERFRTNHSRVLHRAELLPVVSKAVAAVEAGELLQKLHERSVPCGAINSLGEVFQLEEAQPLLLEDETTGLRGVRTIAFQTSFTQRLQLSPPPPLPQ